MRPAGRDTSIPHFWTFEKQQDVEIGKQTVDFPIFKLVFGIFSLFLCQKDGLRRFQAKELHKWLI